jgi:hypothetical protein
MHHMTECQYGKAEGGVRRCLIAALNRRDKHVNKRGAWAPRVASPRKTTGSEQVNMSGGGDPGEWRTHPTRWRSHVDNRAWGASNKTRGVGQHKNEKVARQVKSHRPRRSGG